MLEQAFYHAEAILSAVEGEARLMFPDLRRERFPVCGCHVRQVGHDDVFALIQCLQEIAADESDASFDTMATRVALSQLQCPCRAIDRSDFCFRQGDGEGDRDCATPGADVRYMERLGGRVLLRDFDCEFNEELCFRPRYYSFGCDL